MRPAFDAALRAAGEFLELVGHTLLGLFYISALGPVLAVPLLWAVESGTASFLLPKRPSLARELRESVPAPEAAAAIAAYNLKRHELWRKRRRRMILCAWILVGAVIFSNAAGAPSVERSIALGICAYFLTQTLLNARKADEAFAGLANVLRPYLPAGDDGAAPAAPAPPAQPVPTP